MRDLSSLIDLLKSLPKAELHLHLEGTLEPELMLALAKRNSVHIGYESLQDIQSAYQFGNLQDFLDLYYKGTAVLIQERDFYELAEAYLRKVHAQNVRHVEVFFDPQAHTERGIAFQTVIKGFKSALSEVGEELGISHKLIMCFLRHLPEQAAHKTLEQARPYLQWIDGVGLDSSESGNPPSKFQSVFLAAKELGLTRVAHAGEEGPADYVRQAVELLDVARIDHGNRSLEDEMVVELLVERRIPLTVCPLSNLKLCVVPDIANHPLLDLIEKGLIVTVNSDDPSYFGGYLNENFEVLIQHLELDKNRLVALVKNGFRASFLDPKSIDNYCKEIDSIAAIDS